VIFIKWMSLEASYQTLPFNSQCLLYAWSDLTSKMCVLPGAFCVIFAARNLMNPGHTLSTNLHYILILSSYLWFVVLVSDLQVSCPKFWVYFLFPLLHATNMASSLIGSPVQRFPKLFDHRTILGLKCTDRVKNGPGKYYSKMKQIKPIFIQKFSTCNYQAYEWYAYLVPSSTYWPR